MLREINAANFDFDDPGWAKISSDGRELVKTLLARDARDRLTVYGVLQHPFCAEDVNLAINTSRVSRLQSADFDQALNLLDDDEHVLGSGSSLLGSGGRRSQQDPLPPVAVMRTTVRCRAKLVTVELVSCAAHRGGPGVALPEEEPVDSFNRSSMKLEAMAIS